MTMKFNTTHNPFSPEVLSRRQILIGASSATVGLAVTPGGRSSVQAADPWDLIIVGGGTAGLPAAIFAAQRGARVLVIEASLQLGGTLFLSTGQMSAAGTRLQKQKGISDSPQLHFDDVMRISQNTADPELVRLAVTHAADTFDWLMDNGLTPPDEHPVLGLAHEPYSVERYAWGPEGGISILDAIEPLALAEEQAGRLTIWRGQRVRELLMRDGAVIGVRAENDSGKMTDVFGQSTLLASGGYASNPALFYELSGYKQYGKGSYPYSQGDGYLMALAAGGYTRGKENYRCGSPQILASADEPAAPDTRFVIYPERRQPWEIQVNVHGERYVAEDSASVDVREHALLRQPDLRTWLIFDQAILDQSPSGIEGWDKADFAEAFDSHPMFFKAQTVGELAEKSGVDEENLVATVQQYNRAQVSGADSAFGRTHMPLPIQQAPFYAIRQQGFSITSTVGVAADDQLRVVRQDGSAIEGLYAAGELLGSGQLMGNTAVGGMMVTPALTFGRIFGETLLNLKA
ncbi:MAG: FAD-dependent oxidoreductase [Rhodospirillaceae bacterium]|jgi:fumarate reductase flavoprotein subunit|nr:FAD-dependent oxidoreductase [Rhodospirillaceae bacterium]MBT6088001.1 FAD-dependent oxidoreductase [Rhodospirillaceae bacterium]